MIDRLVNWWRRPFSRKLQYITMKRAQLMTQLVYRWRLRACGAKSIVMKPLFWTPEFLSIGRMVLVWPGCRIEGVEAGLGLEPRIDLADQVSHQQSCVIVTAGALHVGEGTTISYNVTLTDVDHEYETIGTCVLNQPLRVRKTHVGRGCFIGAGARILAGTQLGDHCVVGTNAVVRGEYPPGSVIAGNPARIVRQFDFTTGVWRKPAEAGRPIAAP